MTGNHEDLSPPPPPPSDPVKPLLAAYRQGDEDAFERLFSLLYEDLRRIAHRHLQSEREHHTLSTTALVHEAYVKLARQPPEGGGWRSRAEFLAFTSKAMRHILVDYARHRGAQKRGGSQIQVTLQTDMGAEERLQVTDILALNQALDQLAERDPRLAQVVECRFFGGMTSEETAEALEISLRTAERDWRRAKVYLYHLLQPSVTET